MWYIIYQVRNDTDNNKKLVCTACILKRHDGSWKDPGPSRVNGKLTRKFNGFRNNIKRHITKPSHKKALKDISEEQTAGGTGKLLDIGYTLTSMVYERIMMCASHRYDPNVDFLVTIILELAYSNVTQIAVQLCTCL